MVKLRTNRLPDSRRLCAYSFVELGDLVRVSRKHLGLFSKAKAAKLVRELVDYFLDMEASTGMEVGCVRIHTIVYMLCTYAQEHTYTRAHTIKI